MTGLADATVALDGAIVATGTIDYPRDPAGEFPAPLAGQVHLSRGPGLVLRPCRAPRDPASGFRRVDQVGAVLGIPAELAVPIARALEFGVEQPISIHLPYQAGQLNSSDGGPRRASQPLSDWRMTLTGRGGDVTVRLSAALRATMPLKEWVVDTRDWWRDEGARIDAVFTVDAATRIACFGSYIAELEETVAGDPAVAQATRWPALRLAAAPVGTFVAYGTGARGEWVSIYTTDRTIALSGDCEQQRLPSGFVTRGQCGQPRLWLNGVTLDAIADAIGPDRSHATVTLSDGWFGTVEPWRDREPPWPPTERIVAARFDNALTLAGLTITYRLTTEIEGRMGAGRTIEGSVTLSWELLLLRYPRFAAWTAKLGG